MDNELVIKISSVRDGLSSIVVSCPRSRPCDKRPEILKDLFTLLSECSRGARAFGFDALAEQHAEAGAAIRSLGRTVGTRDLGSFERGDAKLLGVHSFSFTMPEKKYQPNLFAGFEDD